MTTNAEYMLLKASRTKYDNMSNTTVRAERDHYINFQRSPLPQEVFFQPLLLNNLLRLLGKCGS